MIKIVIFASGSGTNAENIIRYFQATKSASVEAVFTNKADAQVIQRAEKYQVPSQVFTKNDLEAGKVLQEINTIQPDLIVLAGFLLKFPQSIVAEYPDKIINIHPALLPKYGGKGMYGMHVHRAVVENKESKTGITIHYVNENYDEGNIIFQKEVTVLISDTPEVVAAKIHELEQDHFPVVIEKLLTNR
ncbi:MAG TPA: phosphoribosylglycinamide formyltransferase [Flavobacterium sp.]|nr:phosphoribosylglycinamide formyltransferase [Flavobacterium sp.]